MICFSVQPVTAFSLPTMTSIPDQHLLVSKLYANYQERKWCNGCKLGCGFYCKAVTVGSSTRCSMMCSGVKHDYDASEPREMDVTIARTDIDMVYEKPKHGKRIERTVPHYISNPDKYKVQTVSGEGDSLAVVLMNEDTKECHVVHFKIDEGVLAYVNMAEIVGLKFIFSAEQGPIKPSCSSYCSEIDILTLNIHDPAVISKIFTPCDGNQALKVQSAA